MRPGEASSMGYELEAIIRPRHGADLDSHQAMLEARWEKANARLAEALASYAALRGKVLPGDPGWLAAQLRIAEARQRCREISDALALLDLSLEPA